MNRSISGRSAFNILAASAVILPSLSVVSCHDANAGKDKAESSLGEHRPDDALNKLMRSLAEGDAPGFAALCVYPVIRPYPLKNIEDSVAMVDYFPVLVDDSLRDRMGRSRVEDWESYGWRGWSIGDDRPIWFDEGVQFVDYQSPAESGLRNILAREELMTLSPQYREGWTPVMTLIQTDGSSILRIDANGDSYRLMEYEDAGDVSGIPAMYLLGSLNHEGSANLRYFEFADPAGIKAAYSPDSDNPDILYFSGPKAGRKEMRVRQGYWRDAIHK